MESDPRKLIDIGLSYIPQESKVAGCIRLAVECYDQGRIHAGSQKAHPQLCAGYLWCTVG